MNEETPQTPPSAPPAAPLGAATSGVAGQAVALPPVPPAAPRHRAAWRTLAFGLVIFLCGAVVGGGGALLRLGRMAERAMQPPDLMADRAAQRLVWSLDLSNEQARKIEEIYKKRFTVMQDSIRSSRTVVQAESQAMREEIEKILEPRQIRKWRRDSEFLERGFPGRGPGAERRGPGMGPGPRPDAERGGPGAERGGPGVERGRPGVGPAQRPGVERGGPGQRPGAAPGVRPIPPRGRPTPTPAAPAPSGGGSI